MEEELGAETEMSQAELQVKRELSWLEMEDITLTFPKESGWSVSPASISRRFLVDHNIMLPTNNIKISEDSLIKDGDVEPIGVLKLDILLDASTMPKDVNVNAR